MDEMAAGGKVVAHYQEEQVWHGLLVVYIYIFCVTSFQDIHATNRIL